jgi:ribose 5-phosphate isomerase
MIKLADCEFVISGESPDDLAHKLSSNPGIIEHGLFPDTTSLIIADDKNSIRQIRHWNSG